MTDWPHVEDTVVRYVQRHGEQKHPHEMISRLVTRGMTEEQVRCGIWRGIDTNRLALTPECTLVAARAKGRERGRDA